MKPKKLCMLASLLALASTATAQQSVRQVELEYQQGDVTIRGVTETQAYLPPGQGGSGNYLIRSLDSSNSTVESRSFGFDLQVYSERNYEVNETSKQILIPRSNSTSRISVYSNGTLEDTVSVGRNGDSGEGTLESPSSPTQYSNETVDNESSPASTNSSDSGEQDGSSPIQSLFDGILSLLPL